MASNFINNNNLCQVSCWQNLTYMLCPIEIFSYFYVSKLVESDSVYLLEFAVQSLPDISKRKYQYGKLCLYMYGIDV